MNRYLTENDLASAGSKSGSERSRVGGGQKGTPAQEYVELIIEDNGTGAAWEGGINGTFYRISRGKPVKVPRNLARLIQANANVTLLSKNELQEYRTGGGKRLGPGVR